MKKMRKSLVVALVSGGFALGAVAAQQAGAADAYKATFYVAGMGGHHAKAECTIDPTKEQPITVSALDKLDIGTKDSHPVHDARIDAKNGDVMFWSTYKLDPATKKLHVGKTDLKTGKKIADVDMELPEYAKETKANYCASAQSADYFLPISMANKGYIDVLAKSDLKLVKRVALEDTEGDIKAPYKFYHGINSPDMKKLFLSINEADAPQGNTVGKLHVMLFDMDEFTKGNVKVLKKNVIPGTEKKTVSFRQYFSPDGKMIANATGDRLIILNADTLEAMDTAMMGPVEETHDAIFTPDNKYVVATSRTKFITGTCDDPAKPKEGEYLMDGQLKLYDLAAKKWVGKPASVCLACHDKEGLKEHAVLCGLDAKWAKN